MTSPELKTYKSEPTISDITVLGRDALVELQPFMDSAQLEGENAVLRPIYEVVLCALVSAQDSGEAQAAARALDILDTLVVSQKEVDGPLSDSGGVFLEQKFELLYAEGDADKTKVTVGFHAAPRSRARYYHGYVDIAGSNETNRSFLEVEVIGETANMWLID